MTRFVAGVLLTWFVSLGLLASTAQAQTAAKQSFDIFEYRVEGNTVLATDKIERAVYRYMGEGKSIDDVEAAQAALEQAYRDNGYGTVVVDIPEQRINEKVVVLKVIQGEVSRLRVTGSSYYSQGRILDKVPALAEGQVPYFPAVQEQLASVNRSADRRIAPVLRPGKQAGTTEVDLEVEDSLPLHGSLEVNNRYSPNTTHTRINAALRYDNLWQRDHSLGFQAQLSPRDTSEVKVYSASYTIPSGNDLYVLTATRSDSNTAAGVGDVTVFGRGKIYSLRNIISLPGDAHLNHSITLGLDYKDLKENVAIGPSSDPTSGYKTPLHYLPLSVSYAAVHSEADGSLWQYGTGLTFSIRGLASKQTQFDDKRYQAQDNFAVLKFDLARLQQISHGVALYAKLDGQVAGQPLISNEQYVAGGVDSVRGYLDSSQVGDTALHGTLELRSPNLLGEVTGWSLPGLQSVTAQAFVDAAALRLRVPLPGQQDRFEMLGVGVGLKLRATKVFSMALDLASPRRSTTYTKAGDLHLHASGVVEF